MFCSNCGNEIKPDDKFCSNCGKQTLSNNENDTCAENTYTTAQKENKGKTILAFIICLCILIAMFVAEQNFGAIPITIVIATVVIIIACTSKSYIGKCPHCDNLVKSNSATSFVCPFCRKNVMIKDSKFWKI